MAKVMTSEQLIQKLKNIVARPNTYKNWFPMNLGYYDGWTISFDCWNLLKALINEPNIDGNWTWGHHAPATGNMPDIDGWAILQRCTDISRNFNNLVAGEYLYMSGHAGIYIGGNSVIECTTDWDGGVQYSTITNTGGRHKNGWWGRSWEYHGKLTEWIDYTIIDVPTLDVDGWWGSKTTAVVQQVLRDEFGYVEVDGIVSSQEIAQKKYLPNAVPTSWEFVEYAKGSPTIVALQVTLNNNGCNAGDTDGIMGRQTVSALQRFLNERGASPQLDVDGEMGEMTVSAYQTFLNKIT